MMPGNDLVVTRHTTGPKRRWHRPIRCSVCTGSIWLRPIALKEPADAPEPHQEWTLCKPCHEALVAEMRRSPLDSPVRLRVAIGLVAAERSPEAYHRGAYIRERQQFQREFAWIVWLLVFFTLLHLIIFVILLAVPK